ncbi:putative tail fiber [Psychrobacillus phage Spoks]|nr:putative tail fiber [Psychrobacillus phage Spoks]
MGVKAVKFPVTVDFKIPTYINKPVVTQNDAITFVVEVFDDGMPFDLSSISTFTLVSDRPGLAPVMTIGTVTGLNEVTFTFGSNESAKVGDINATIQLYDVDGRLSTVPFVYQVRKDPLKDFVPSENEKTLIELVLGHGPAILDAAEQATQDANTAANNANQAITNVGTAINGANQAANNANTKANLADTAATNANQKAESANDAATNANLARDNALQAKTDAEQATTDAINATNAINIVLPNVEGLGYVEAYNSITAYRKNNIVSYRGSSYIALQNTINNPPTETTYWGLLAIKGLDGAGSVVTVNGISPDQNGNVELAIPYPDLSNYVEKGELEEVQPTSLALNRGVQIVKVPIGSPVNVLNFIGKTIINYAPLFDIGLWEYGTPSKVSTNSSNKVTITITDGIMAYLATLNTKDVIPVKANTQYTLSVKHNATISVIDAMNFNNVIVPSTTQQTVTFNSGVYTSVRVVLTSLAANGTYTFENVMLNAGTVAQEFVANVKGVTNPTIENKTTKDSLTIVGTFHEGDKVRVEKGQVIVARKKKEVVLDGSLDWKFDLNKTGYKSVYVLMTTGTANVLPTGIKYNGKILTGYLDGAKLQNGGADGIFISATVVEVTVSNADSGWGESYTPTADEIKAYFMGWKMYNNNAVLPNQYNGIGVKAWGKTGLQNADGNFSGTGGVDFAVSTLPTTQTVIYPKWQPYRLIHDLDSPVDEPVKTNGALKFAKGDNTVEVTEGRIVRERANVVFSTFYNRLYANISDGFSQYIPNGSVFKNKVDVILKCYRNGVEIKDWYTSANGGNGRSWVKDSPTSDDKNAIYEVDYIPLEPYKVSAYETPITIEYQDKLGSVVAQNVKGIANIESRMSSNESVLGEVISNAPNYAKKTQEDWKTVVLQNGWGGTIRYRKNDFGVVYIEINLTTIGTTTANTVVGSLPVGYGPHNYSAILTMNTVTGTTGNGLYVFGNEIRVNTQHFIAGGVVFGIISYYAK